MSRSGLHVLVIGGGIGGLCLAQGLKRMGISVAVYERDASPDARLQGYRLNIEPVGSQALHACLPPELWDVLVATAGDPGPRMGVFDEQLRELMHEDEPGAESDPTRSHHAVSRITLRRLLLAGLDDVVHFNKKFVRYELAGDGTVTAFFSDGSSATGHVLIGADGARSRVRKQFLPDAREVHIPAVGIGGKLPITADTATWLPGHLQSTKNMILPPINFFFTAAFRQRQGTNDVISQIGGQLRELGLNPQELLDQAEDYDYVMWAFVAHRKSFRHQRDNPTVLKHAIEQSMERWSPVLQRLVRESNPGTIQAFDFAAAAKPKPWNTSNVSLLGDALHYMPPVGGMGGNAALHDAQLLCSALNAVNNGSPLLPSLHACEAGMLAYGFKAVQASLLYTRLGISRTPLMRPLAKLFFRTCGVVGPLRRAIFEESPLSAAPRRY
jgi:2-polyprenyl-6-methoxyphenol hydroxylase-like FAD-dependent oxidoreductase